MSFEVTVTPTVYDVDVSVNPSVQPFDVEVTVGNVPDLDLTTNGDSGASTFDPLTGELNIPEYTLDGLGGVPESRTITINGTTQDLSANRTFTIPAEPPLGFTPENVANKAINLTSPDDTKYPTTLAVSTALAGKQDVLTNPITGTGASGQVSFWTGTGTQSGDSKLTWNNTTGGLTINSSETPAPLRGLVVNQANDGVQAPIITFTKSRGTIASPTNVSTNDLVGFFTFSARVGGVFTSDRAFFAANMATATGIGLAFGAGTSDGYYTPAIYIHPTRNVVLGTTGSIITGGITDTGFKLDVNGTARIQGNLTTNLTAGSVPFIGTSGLLTQDNSNLFWDDTNKRLGIGTNAPDSLLDVNGSSIFRNNITANFGVLNRTAQLRSDGLHISRLSNGGYVSSITADGSIYYGTRNNHYFICDTNTRLVLFENGNLTLGTTIDAGFRLDVNGTARVQGTLTLTGAIRTNFFNSQNNVFTIFGANQANGNAKFYQAVSIGTSSDPVASAQLEIVSTTKGFLPPRMTGAQAEAISSPAEGLLVYSTDGTGTTITSKGWWGFNGSTWAQLN